MNEQDTPQVVWHPASVTQAMRERQNGHRGRVVWFTGLSGAGKSTLANAVEVALHENGYRTFAMDGDNLRHGLCKDLGFSSADRSENLRRIAEVARLFVEAGVIVLTAFISPRGDDRVRAKQIIGPEHFMEVWVDCPLAVCEERDVKGMYRKARTGEIKEFTGISAPYEAPLDADLVLQTDQLSIDACVAATLAKMGLGRGR